MIILRGGDASSQNGGHLNDASVQHDNVIGL